eukprot:SAG31_NODE_15654_length_744_cov_1.069767_1_plen_53_part_10
MVERFAVCKSTTISRHTGCLKNTDEGHGGRVGGTIKAQADFPHPGNVGNELCC